MPLGLSLSTLGNLGRATSRAVGQHAQAKEQERLLAGQDADRKYSALLLKAASEPNRTRRMAIIRELQSLSNEPGLSPQLATQSAKFIRELAALPEPETPEEFTLTPGGKRFRGSEMIAENPKAEPGFSLSPGQQRFDSKGNRVARVAPIAEGASPSRTFSVGGEDFEVSSDEFETIKEDARSLQSTIQKLPVFLQSNQLERSFEQLQNLFDKIPAEGNVGASDISIINTFQRLIDPATVREGDVALVQSAESFLGRVSTALKNFATGDKLSPELRKNMVDAAKVLINAYRKDAREKAEAAINAQSPIVHPAVPLLGRSYIDALVGQPFEVEAPAGGGSTDLDDIDAELADIDRQLRELE